MTMNMVMEYPLVEQKHPVDQKHPVEQKHPEENNIWSKLDHVISKYAKDISLIPFCMGCFTKIYYGYICTSTHFILCNKCFTNYPQVFATIFKATLVDNPITCHFDDCKKSIFYSYFDGMDLKICIECYWKLQDRIVPLDVRTYVCMVSGKYYPFLLNISDVNRTHPPVDISYIQMNAWTDLIHNLMFVDVNFGSIKQWACFTKINTLPECTPMISSCMLIDCGNHGGRIANVITWEIQGTYLTRVDIVYDCVDDYVNDRDIWLNEKRDCNMINKLYKNIPNDILQHRASNIAILCRSFSGYIRCKKIGLPYV